MGGARGLIFSPTLFFGAFPPVRISKLSPVAPPLRHLELRRLMINVSPRHGLSNGSVAIEILPLDFPGEGVKCELSLFSSSRSIAFLIKYVFLAGSPSILERRIEPSFFFENCLRSPPYTPYEWNGDDKRKVLACRISLHFNVAFFCKPTFFDVPNTIP